MVPSLVFYLILSQIQSILSHSCQTNLPRSPFRHYPPAQWFPSASPNNYTHSFCWYLKRSQRLHPQIILFHLTLSNTNPLFWCGQSPHYITKTWCSLPCTLAFLFSPAHPLHFFFSSYKNSTHFTYSRSNHILSI